MAEARNILAFLILFALASSCRAAPGNFQAPPHEGPLPVSLGMIVVDLRKIDDVDQSFEAVVIVRLSWVDPRLAGDGVRVMPLAEVWSPRFQITNEILARTQFRDLVHVAPDGTVVHMQRFTGRFSAPLDLRAFPFDTQTLQLRVTFPDHEPEELEPVPAPEFTGMLETVTTPEWFVGGVELRSDPIEPLANIKRASAVLSFDINRKPDYYVFKIIAPMVLIVFMSWTVFWISHENVGAQIGVATSSMLTLIAYRFILGNLLPRVSYLTQLDLFIFGATLLVFLALLVVVMSGHLVRVGREGDAQRVDAGARLAFPAAFILLIVVVFVF